MKKKYSFFYRNGLSIAFLLFFLASIAGQCYSGWKVHNNFLKDYNMPAQDIFQYLQSGHFIQATFENWESEFFQMALFVILTIFLRQQGSAESKKCDEPFYDKSELLPKLDSPKPVKKRGLVLLIYKNSLSI